MSYFKGLGFIDFDSVDYQNQYSATAGDLYGPASSTDNAVPRFNGTSGKLVQGSGITIDDSNDMAGANKITTGALETNFIIDGAGSGGSISFSGADVDNIVGFSSATVETTGNITCGNAIITSYMSGGGGDAAIAFSSTPLSFVGPIGCNSVTAINAVQGSDVEALKNVNGDGPRVYLKNRYYAASSTDESNEIIAQFYNNSTSDYVTGGRIEFTKQDDYNTATDCTSWMNFYPVTEGTEKRALSLRTDKTVVYDILDVYHSATQNLQISETGATSMKIDHTGGLSITGPDGVAMVFDALNEQWLEILPKSTNEVEIKTGSGNLELRSTSGVVRSTSDFEVYESGTQNMELKPLGVSSMQIVSTGVLALEPENFVRSAKTYANTSASAANVYIDTTGDFYRSTSSIKYKKDVHDYDKGLNTLMKLQPKYYKPKEGVAGGDFQYAGLIAEDLFDLGLNEFISFSSDERTKDHVEGIGYDRMVALLINSVKDQQKKIDSLQSQIDDILKKID